MPMVSKVLLQALGQDSLGTIYREKVPFTLLLHGDHCCASTYTNCVFRDIN